MGFEEGRIILDSETGTFDAGTSIKGRLVFDQRQSTVIQGIYISCIGFCKVHWTTTEKRKEDGIKVKHLVDHDAYEEYINQKYYVFGDAGSENHLTRDHYQFRFDFPIPGSCPSSFESTHGHIRYQVKAVMVVSKETVKEKLCAVRVHAPVDLNQNPYCKEPIKLDLYSKFYRCCLSCGHALIRVELPAGGFCPGQTMPHEIVIINNSSVEIDALHLILIKTVTYTASDESTQQENKGIFAKKHTSMQAHSKAAWTSDIVLAEIEVHNLSGCRFIDVAYRLTAILEPSGSHKNTVRSCPIVIGNIPLTSTEDKNEDRDKNDRRDDVARRPLELQHVGGAYYPPPPVTNQPMFNYPQNIPYSPGMPQSPPNMHYPTAPNHPYPDPMNQPFQNPPYPIHPGIHPGQPYPSPPPVASQANPPAAAQAQPQTTNVTVTLNIPNTPAASTS